MDYSFVRFFFFLFACGMWVYTSKLSERRSAKFRHLDQNRSRTVRISCRSTLILKFDDSYIIIAKIISRLLHLVEIIHPKIFLDCVIIRKMAYIQNCVAITNNTYVCSRFLCRELRSSWSSPDACGSPCTCSTSCATTANIKTNNRFLIYCQTTSWISRITYSATGQHPLGFVDVATATGASFASRSLRHWLLGTRSRAIAVWFGVVRNEIG